MPRTTPEELEEREKALLKLAKSLDGSVKDSLFKGDRIIKILDILRETYQKGWVEGYNKGKQQ